MILRAFAGWAAAHRLRYAGIIAALLVLQGVVVYGRLTSTTEVTTEKALSEFRERQAAATTAPGPQQEGGPSAITTAPPSVPSAPPAATKGPSARQPTCEWVCATNFTAPAQGVYEWFQCGREAGQCTAQESEPQGSESFGGLSRPLPRKGQRSIIVTASNKWTSYHQYAEEHREEFDLFVDQTGVFGDHYKVNITIGGLPGGTDIRQAPPARFMQFPSSVGIAWNGHWEDRNDEADADYAGKIIDRQEISMGGRRVRTWVVEIKMKLLGPKSNGDVLVRLWVSPEMRQTIQEFYDQDITNEQGINYKGKWMITLANPQPRS